MRLENRSDNGPMDQGLAKQPGAMKLVWNWHETGHETAGGTKCTAGWKNIEKQTMETNTKWKWETGEKE